MKWCEHITDYDGEDEIEITQKDIRGLKIKSFGWNFCHICGTPRPKEKSLVEKIREHGIYCKDPWDVCYEHLAKIAEQHFEERKSS